jgi:hypothetical protein
MPQQVRMPRYISQKNSTSWDDIIGAVIQAGKLGEENHYFGITTEERAQEVYRKLRTAATHHGHARKVFWYPCTGCKDGGQDCRYHVSFTLFDMETARAYKAGQSQQKPGKNRQ